MAKIEKKISNPFRPGAGHMPPYLAGREKEVKEFERLLAQDTILQNVILTGLRGLGKTVLLETFKPMAIQAGWLWAGTDLSESTSMSEETLATRLLADLSVVTSSIVLGVAETRRLGFAREADQTTITLNYPTLRAIYDNTPGLIIDKLKAVLEAVAPRLAGKRGIVFAYDEAQNLADHAPRDQYPMSTLLDLFQSIQRKNIPFMLVLTGLPTLLPKLVHARTFSERMFHQITLNRLTKEATSEAISKPIIEQKCPVNFEPLAVDVIWSMTHGYPYFIQFVCREIFDIWVQCLNDGGKPAPIPMDAIVRKLDADFFSGRWSKVTDRQRDLLTVVAFLDNCDGEFTVQDIITSEFNATFDKPFSGSNTSQMLSSLTDAGLVYKNRHGKYSFAVPLLGSFIRRTLKSELMTIKS